MEVINIAHQCGFVGFDGFGGIKQGFVRSPCDYLFPGMGEKDPKFRLTVDGVVHDVAVAHYVELKKMSENNNK